MEQQPSPVPGFNLELAIDPRPLTVSPDTSVQEAIGLMGKAQSSCVVPGLELSLHPNLQRQARAQVLLVVDRDRLLGVFGESEALRAIASGVDLTLITMADRIVQPAIALTYSPDATLFTALALLRQHQIHHLPVVDDQDSLVGLITAAGIRAALQVDDLLKSHPVAEVAQDPVIQAPQTTSALALACLMADHQVNQVILTSTAAAAGMTASGVISARNLILLSSLGLNLARLPATAVLNSSLPCFSASESVLAAYWHMQQQQTQHFLVTAPTGEWLGLGTPTSFLYTLDLQAIQDVAIAVEQSIEEFASDRDRFTPPPLPTAESAASLNLEELREQLACSRLLERMALHIRESLQLNNILQTAVDEVRQFLKTERVIIYHFSPDWSGRVVVESVAEGWQPALESTTRDTCFGQNYAQAYKAGRTHVIDDIYTVGFSQCHIDILVLFDVRASLVVPILQGDHLWGLLCAYHCSEPRHWRPFEVELLKQLATHMAIAIQQSELYHQLQNELAERKKAEAQLKTSLREKESLLKEIHHRVKNNLQVISSVLRLQSDYVKDEHVLELFKDSQNRIRSMALIHEKLYQSSDLSRINLSEYLTELTGNLVRSYTSGAAPIRLKITPGDVWLNIDTAIPCGLIINELVSNAIKHAFPMLKETNEIGIDVQRINSEQFTLIVRDNGIGFPETLDFRNTESLGLELVCIFTEQLGGRIELDRSNGTTFTLTFSEMRDAGRE